MNIIIKDNDDLLADFAADLITSEIQKNPSIKICFATGNSPIKTYKKLIQKYQKNQISFENVVSLNLDEYVGIQPKTLVHITTLWIKTYLIILILKERIFICQTE